jgi:hypothetical protein
MYNRLCGHKKSGKAQFWFAIFSYGFDFHGKPRGCAGGFAGRV